MIDSNVAAAAATLWRHFQNGTKIDELPASQRPSDRTEAYAVQSAIAQASGQEVVGWKIAATSRAGQRHIGVDEPLAAPLFAGRVAQQSAAVPVFPLNGNIMKVAEIEFAFRFATSLPRRSRPYTEHEVLAAVESLHPAIEIPDSRYLEFAKAGGPQLIADLACACWFVLGPATNADWRSHDLRTHPANGFLNGELVVTGTGANVLGDPRIALTWMANELARFGTGIEAGQFVTTGTCIVPLPVAPGDRVRADFADLGSVEVRLT